MKRGTPTETKFQNLFTTQFATVGADGASDATVTLRQSDFAVDAYYAYPYTYVETLMLQNPVGADLAGSGVKLTLNFYDTDCATESEFTAGTVTTAYYGLDNAAQTLSWTYTHSSSTAATKCLATLHYAVTLDTNSALFTLPTPQLNSLTINKSAYPGPTTVVTIKPILAKSGATASDLKK